MKSQLFLMAFMVGTAYPVWAEDNANPARVSREIYVGMGLSPDDQPLHLELGLSLGVIPAYEGGDGYSAIGSALFNITQPGVYFIHSASVNPNDGLFSAGLRLVDFGYRDSNGHEVKVNLGPYLRLHPGRDEGDDDVLNGLGDIDASIGLGLFLDVEVGDWMLQLAAAPHEVDKSADDGLLVSLDIRYRAFSNHKWTFDTGLASSWGNDKYIQGYFGVNPVQSAASEYAVYDARGGLKDIGIYVQSSYAYTPDWMWHTQIGYWELQGDAADSPIVATGSTGQLRALIGLAYKF